MTDTALMAKVVIYTRFSPRKNADTSESCETQLAYCEQFAHDKGWEIVDKYHDKAVSGKEENRPLLWKAIDSLRPGGVLLVYKHDRLARDVYLSEMIRRGVEKLGAKIVAVNGDVEGDGPEQVMVRQILACFAEYERKIIAMRTSHAMQHHQKCGRRMGRHAPYGAETDPDDATRWKVCLAEKPAVDKILKLHACGKSLHEIVVYLNENMRFLARSQKVGWDQRTIKRVLSRK